MKNTADKDVHSLLELPNRYKRNSSMEALRTRVFKQEYKPNARIDFKQIKDLIVAKKEKYGKLSEYNYNIMDPEDICNYFIENPPKESNISFLESFSKHMKRCIADMFLNLFSFDFIQKKLGTAMLFRIWNHGYHYSDKRKEDLLDFLKNSSFVGSEKNIQLLKKCDLMQWQLHQTSGTIDAVLLFFEMMKNLGQDILSEEIQNYLKHKMGEGFTLCALYPRNDNKLGKEEIRYGKELNALGNDISRESFMSTFTRKTYTINHKEKSMEVVDRKSPDLSKDWSGSYYDVYLDGPVAIGLFHNKEPVAVISFSLQDVHTIFIHQIQAINIGHFDTYGRMLHQKTNPILQPLPRQETLYGILSLLAKKYQCKKIILQSGENNKWTREKQKELTYNEEEQKQEEIYTDKVHLPLDIAKQIYDTFALKHGFKRNKKSNNWDKKI
ncbi:MAG: hypothetical protein NTY80_05115 [candidate division SR1 bacterium]|nr:hypothetical protein [candidate division SR1 bacterium]